MPTASALGKTYCPNCGWNRGEADAQTRLFLRLLPALVALFDAPLILYIFSDTPKFPFLRHWGCSRLSRQFLWCWL